MKMIFFITLFMTLYPYAVYPLLVYALARVVNRKWRTGKEQPMITLIISVYNEEKVIRAKIENALALGYPLDRLQILVVSDGSTDATDQIAACFTDRRVELKAYERAGKTTCLNRAVAEAKGEILVFTDANSMFPPQVLAKMARNFLDPEVGLVTGWTKYRRPGSGEEEAPGLYARLEKITKEWESLVSSCVGADGAIFAMRKEFYRPLEGHDINDFVIPLHVMDQKKRVVLDPDVYCLEEPTADASREFPRQARITNRTLGAIRRYPRFLNPLRYGSFAFFLLSHKILRLMVPFFGVGLMLSGLLLATTGAFYSLVVAGMCLFLLAGLAGLLGIGRSKAINLAAVFLLTNLAQVVGWARFVRGRADTLWIPQR
jgi:cellulose synthase/poly-beta-1,6-N-acetylglucosamine synthase-like glycosyltransferase